MFIMR